MQGAKNGLKQGVLVLTMKAYFSPEKRVLRNRVKKILKALPPGGIRWTHTSQGAFSDELKRQSLDVCQQVLRSTQYVLSLVVCRIEFHMIEQLR